MKRYFGNHVYTIQPSDVGNRFIRVKGWPREYPGGIVQKRDVHKLVMEHDGVLQVENDEQFNRRFATRHRPFEHDPHAIVRDALADAFSDGDFEVSDAPVNAVDGGSWVAVSIFVPTPSTGDDDRAVDPTPAEADAILKAADAAASPTFDPTLARAVTASTRSPSTRPVAWHHCPECNRSAPYAVLSIMRCPACDTPMMFEGVYLPMGGSVKVWSAEQSLRIDCGDAESGHPGALGVDPGDFQYLAGNDAQEQYSEIHGPASVCDGR